MSVLLDESGGDAQARVESWRYSRNALRALEQQDFADSATGLAIPPELAARFFAKDARARRLVFVNGALSDAHSDAHMDDDTLDLADGACVHLVFVHLAGTWATRWRRALRILLRNGRAEVFEQHLGTAGADVFGALDVAFETGAGAQLTTTLLGDLPDSASLIRREHLQMTAGAHHASTHALFGGRLQRFDIAVELSGVQACYTARGVFAPRARQHIDVHMDVRHAARDTVSDVSWRGVADGRGRGILHGAITVAPGADGADARLRTKNLLLSPHAEIDAQPVLEIYADEVKASHGATVGQLDERALFYLRSRGVPLNAARNLLIAGFCREAFENIPDETLRAHLESALDSRLPRTSEAAA